MVTEKAHALFSASGSHRWLACPASIRLSQTVPPPRESQWAKEGTDAHTVLERLVRSMLAARTDPKKMRATVAMLRQRFPEALISHALTALEYIQKRWQELPGSELFVEVKAALPISEPGQFGTADIVIAEHFGKLIVMDYKFGAGVPIEVVSAEGVPNSQLIYYALGVAHQFDYNFADVEIIIIQPRAAIAGKTIRSYTTDIDTLLEWREKFDQGVRLAKSKNPPYQSGDHCRWCPAKIVCPELRDKAFKQAQIDFPDDENIGGKMHLPAIEHRLLPAAKLAQILPALDRIEKWIDAMRTHAFERLESGEKIPGFRLIEKRATRKWNDPVKAMKEAQRLFGDSAFSKPELLSPAELEKGGTRARDFVRENATAVSSGLKLAADPIPDEFPDDFADEKSDRG